MIKFSSNTFILKSLLMITGVSQVEFCSRKQSNFYEIFFIGSLFFKITPMFHRNFYEISMKQSNFYEKTNGERMTLKNEAQRT